MWSIAKKNKLSVDDLKKYNNLSSNLLYVGQKLLLNDIPQKDDSSNAYIVKQGDNLYAISKMFGTSVDKLKQVNNLNSDVLSIGQKLTIPTEEKTYDVYTVKKGDTLYSLARLYNTTVTNIQTINNLETSILQIGQKLLVPKK